MHGNICLFIPSHSSKEAIHIINFVLETKPQHADHTITLSYYRMHFVLSGKGVLRVGGRELALQEGDFFFCLPNTPYSLESLDGFSFAFISFLGTRAGNLIDRFRIHGQNCVFRGFQALSTAWKEGLQCNGSIIDLKSEGILLSSFAEIGEKYYPSAEQTSEGKLAFAIKQYIDEHFSNPDLSLNLLSSTFNYHPKYLSSLFKGVFKIGFSDYLTTVRLQNACVLMQQGLTEIKSRALLCGFHDPLYFSKVFKQRLEATPKAYALALREQRSRSTQNDGRMGDAFSGEFESPR